MKKLLLAAALMALLPIPSMGQEVGDSVVTCEEGRMRLILMPREWERLCPLATLVQRMETILHVRVRPTVAWMFRAQSPEARAAATTWHTQFQGHARRSRRNDFVTVWVIDIEDNRLATVDVTLLGKQRFKWPSQELWPRVGYQPQSPVSPS